MHLIFLLNYYSQGLFEHNVRGRNIAKLCLCIDNPITKILMEMVCVNV